MPEAIYKNQTYIKESLDVEPRLFLLINLRLKIEDLIVSVLNRIAFNAYW